tara:strand:+ start:6553 stop:6861 length:309 start_codon:yes stop_codon:yes gene_type:complete
MLLLECNLPILTTLPKVPEAEESIRAFFFVVFFLLGSEVAAIVAYISEMVFNRLSYELNDSLDYLGVGALGPWRICFSSAEGLVNIKKFDGCRFPFGRIAVE